MDPYTLLSTAINSTPVELIPNLTEEQARWAIGYYKPSAESKGKYPDAELVYQCCRSDIDPSPFINAKDDVVNITTFHAFNRSDLMYQFYPDHDLVKLLITDEPVYTSDVYSMICHRDVTVEDFIDIVYKMYLYNTDLPLMLSDMRTLFTGQGTSNILATLNYTGHPAIADLANRLGQTYTVSVAQEPVLAILNKTGSILSVNPYIELQLCNYDFNYPTHDIADDIHAGNYIEALRKINTCDTDIEFELCNPKVEYYTNYLGQQLPYVCDHPARCKVLSQVLYSLHPNVINDYLKIRGFDIDLDEYSNTLLTHWCFPDADTSHIDCDFSLVCTLSNYYQPHPLMIGNWDPSILLERAYMLGYTDEECLPFISAYNTGNYSPEVGINMVILSYYYSRSSLICQIESQSPVVEFFQDMFTGNTDAKPAGITFEILTMIINTSYLSCEDKLEIIGAVNNYTPPTLVRGILGDTYYEDDSMYIAGIVINASVDKRTLIEFADYIGKDLIQKFDMEYVENILSEIIEAGNANDEEVDEDFPIGLIASETEALECLDESLPYSKELAELMSHIDSDKYVPTTKLAVINSCDYYTALNGFPDETTEVTAMGVSKYGYKIINYPSELF